MASFGKTPRAARAENRNKNREAGFPEAPNASKGKKAPATSRGKTPAKQPAPANDPAPISDPAPPRESTPARDPTPPRQQTPVRNLTPQRVTIPARELTPPKVHTPPAARTSPVTLTSPVGHTYFRDPSPHDAENEDALSDDSVEVPLQSHNVPLRSPPLGNAIRLPSQPSEVPSSRNPETVEVPPSVPSGPEAGLPNEVFRRVTLASGSFNVPWPFCEMFALQALLLEYKRLTPFRRTPTIPFDVYTIQFCGVNNIHVSDSVRRFVTPQSILHRHTEYDHPRNRILEGYLPVQSHGYSSRNIREAHRGIIDAKHSGNHAIYNVSEFSFHLDNNKRAWMDSIFPFICFFYHILLTYIRYLAVTSNFLPILGNCSFTTRMMVRFGFGLSSTYVYSNPAIFVQSVLGMLVQWLFYTPHSSSAEIRDGLKTAPLYGWVLLHGFFYLLALIANLILADNNVENIPWLPVISSNAIWDIIGMGLDPLPITLKLACGYYTYHCVTKHFHVINDLYNGLRQTAKKAEEEVRAANAIWQKLNNTSAIVTETSSEL